MTAELATTQAELEARTEARPQEAPAEPRPPVKIVWRLEPRCTVMGLGATLTRAEGRAEAGAARAENHEVRPAGRGHRQRPVGTSPAADAHWLRRDDRGVTAEVRQEPAAAALSVLGIDHGHHAGGRFGGDVSRTRWCLGGPRGPELDPALPIYRIGTEGFRVEPVGMA